MPIVTHVGGVEELIPDEGYGRVIDGMDPALVASAVRELAADRVELRRMAEKLQLRVDDEFSWRKTARKVETRMRSRLTALMPQGRVSRRARVRAGLEPPAATVRTKESKTDG